METETTPESEDAPEWITVKAAAGRLQLSERAVQLRVKNNQITHRREAGKIYVRLDATPPARPAPPAASGPAPQAEPDASALIAQLESEVAFLRGLVGNHAEEIARRDQAEAEFRRLLLQNANMLEEARHRNALLEAAPTPNETETGPSPSRPFWKRIFSRA